MYKLIQIWDHTSFHLNKLFFYVCLGASGLFVLSYFFDGLFDIALALLLFVGLSVMVDAFLLYRKRKGIEASRLPGERLSNGDPNKIVLRLKNKYDYRVN